MGEGDSYLCMVLCNAYIRTYVRRLKACEQRRSELFEKQGRGQRFTTMKERDTWIKSVCCTKFPVLCVPINFVVNSLGSQDPIRVN